MGGREDSEEERAREERGYQEGEARQLGRGCGLDRVQIESRALVAVA